MPLKCKQILTRGI